tara:strand:- start:393 stop:1511 length:1119 start_codon:yes stop_codon:yes gene_type:complete
MTKLLFRKLSLDIINFFLAASLSITLIIWVIQAVNFLDIVSEDGHSLKVYFLYSILSMPKILGRILIFVFFISCFYMINKYEENNEILVFWTNGIKKISVINFILRLSILFIIIQLFLSLYLVPLTQNLSRIYLKNSNVDFLPSLITEKKFINVFKNLTIFIDSYDQNGNIKNIYINEKIDNNSSKIIVAESGKIQKIEDQFLIKLFNGSIINSNENNFYNMNFKETEYDLSNFSTKTVTIQKVQQEKSLKLLNCVYDFYIKQKKSNKVCPRKIDSITEEIYKRVVIPFYILILSLISSSLLIKPKSNKYFKYYKSFIFLIGFLFIIISQIGSKFIIQNLINDLLVLFAPIIFVVIFYLIILFKTNFKLKYL